MISYAQNFEDVILARVFNGQNEGFYVDVGAGDPVYLSVTKWFYDQGWSGINIEPNAALFRKLTADRLRDVNLNCGAGAERGEAVFFETEIPELSTFDQRLAASAQVKYEKRSVRILPLTEIVDQYAKDRTIDFLKIDVEGWERQVLTGLDLRRHRPTVITIEATSPQTRIESATEWDSLLLQSDYACVCFDGLNKFYLAGEKSDLERHFALPPNVFDDFQTDRLVKTEACLAETQAYLAKANAYLAETQTHLAKTQAELVRANAARPDLTQLHTLLTEVVGNTTRSTLADSKSGCGQNVEQDENIEELHRSLGHATRILHSRKATLRHFFALNRAWIAKSFWRR